MDFYMKDGVIIRSAELEEKKSKGKKGGGVSAILLLAKDLMDFQDKVTSCIESQDITENKQRIEKHAESLSAMYDDLLDLAKGAVKAIREKPVEGMDQSPSPAANPEVKPESLLKTPSIPKLSQMGI